MKNHKAHVRAVPTVQKDAGKLGNNMSVLHDYTWMLLVLETMCLNNNTVSQWHREEEDG